MTPPSPHHRHGSVSASLTEKVLWMMKITGPLERERRWGVADWRTDWRTSYSAPSSPFLKHIDVHEDAAHIGYQAHLCLLAIYLVYKYFRTRACRVLWDTSLLAFHLSLGTQWFHELVRLHLRPRTGSPARHSHCLLAEAGSLMSSSCPEALEPSGPHACTEPDPVVISRC